jgi:hypothetical protein
VNISFTTPADADERRYQTRRNTWRRASWRRQDRLPLHQRCKHGDADAATSRILFALLSVEGAEV